MDCSVYDVVVLSNYKLYFVCLIFCFSYLFFFRQKTAYEMRISDWSSDVCSSDLLRHRGRHANGRRQLCSIRRRELCNESIANGAEPSKSRFPCDLAEAHHRSYG